MRAGIVCGLRLEARCFADHEKTPHSDLDLAVGAGAAAAAAAASLIRGKAPALMSVGLAGALDGSLNTGDVILATRVIDTLGNGYECDTAWREQLMVAVGRAGLPVRLGGLLGGEAVFASREEKQHRFGAHEAIAADTESHHVGKLALAAALPFMALRVIVDTQVQTLPPAALFAYASDGTLRPWALAGQLLRRPWQIPAMIGLGRASKLALAHLGRVGRLGNGLAPRA